MAVRYIRQRFGLHHVHPGRGQFAWDWGFVLASALLIALGLVRAAAPHRAT